MFLILLVLDRGEVKKITKNQKKKKILYKLKLAWAVSREFNTHLESSNSDGSRYVYIEVTPLDFSLRLCQDGSLYRREMKNRNVNPKCFPDTNHHLGVTLLSPPPDCLNTFPKTVARFLPTLKHKMKTVDHFVKTPQILWQMKHPLRKYVLSSPNWSTKTMHTAHGKSLNRGI